MTTKKFEQLYKTVKTELQSECSNIRYFNKLFLKQMLQAIQSENYTEVFTTDLYNKNGCTYCAVSDTAEMMYKNSYIKVGNIKW